MKTSQKKSLTFVISWWYWTITWSIYRSIPINKKKVHIMVSYTADHLDYTLEHVEDLVPGSIFLVLLWSRSYGGTFLHIVQFFFKLWFKECLYLLTF